MSNHQEESMYVPKSRRRFVNACAIAASALLVASQSVRAADYLLDANYSGTNGAAFGNYAAAYNNIASALAGVPAGSAASNPNRLYIAPGTYNTANSMSTAGLSYSRANVDFIGMTGNPNDVVITSTLDGALVGTTNSATLQLKGNNQSASGITFANSTDTPYIVNTSHLAVNPDGTNSATAQTQTQPCVALLLQGDQQAFKNCKILGYQDTLYTKGGRAYFTNCTVSGDDDFIFANGTDVFKNSVINIDGDHAGGAIIAPSTDKRQSNGIVFLNSTITGSSVHGNTVIDSQNGANLSGPAAGSMYLGRPWGWQQVGGDAGGVYINTIMGPFIKPIGWVTWNTNETNTANGKNGGNPAEDSRFAEYNSTSDGSTLVDVSQRATWSHQLTASQAAAYTVANIFSPESGYAWYGQGYTAGDLNNPGTGSPNPSDPNYSFPAYWGDRNSNNDTTNATVSQTYPTPGNPAGYTNPNWSSSLPGGWDPDAQLALAPEPASLAMLGVGSMLFLRRRLRRKE
jgi:pectinesterase